MKSAFLSIPLALQIQSATSFSRPAFVGTPSLAPNNHHSDILKGLQAHPDGKGSKNIMPLNVTSAGENLKKAKDACGKIWAEINSANDETHAIFNQTQTDLLKKGRQTTEEIGEIWGPVSKNIADELYNALDGKLPVLKCNNTTNKTPSRWDRFFLPIVLDKLGAIKSEIENYLSNDDTSDNSTSTVQGSNSVKQAERIDANTNTTNQGSAI